jgi:molybdopterin synthase catalytic subunit
MKHVGRHSAAIGPGVIDVAALIAKVASGASGATSLFLGTVRDVNEGRAVTGIEYSVYASMAGMELGKICVEAGSKFYPVQIAVEHRTGTLTIGDVSVAIAVSHAHRAQALDATRFIIEELKKRVPIWKREHYADGTREWVDPTAKLSQQPAT